LTEQRVREVLALEGYQIETIPPGWFAEIANHFAEYLNDEAYAAVKYAIEEAGSPDDYPKINHVRIAKFCEWIQKHIAKQANLDEDAISVYLSGEKDGMVAISIDVSDFGEVEPGHTVGLARLEFINREEITFEEIYKTIKFWG
jgi:hypothetical protein